MGERWVAIRLRSCCSDWVFSRSTAKESISEARVRRLVEGGAMASCSSESDKAASGIPCPSFSPSSACQSGLKVAVAKASCAVFSLNESAVVIGDINIRQTIEEKP